MTEEWRPVVGFEAHYEVSNFGAVRRTAPAKRTFAGRVLKPRFNPDGYTGVVLCADRRRTTVAVHRLVAAAFIGHPNGMEVNHKDGCKHNNALDNLEYVTRSENQRHAYKTGLHVALKGETNPYAKLTNAQVLEIRSSSRPLRVFAERFGVSISAVHLARAGKSWASAAVILFALWSSACGSPTRPSGQHTAVRSEVSVENVPSACREPWTLVATEARLCSAP